MAKPKARREQRKQREQRQQRDEHDKHHTVDAALAGAAADRDYATARLPTVPLDTPAPSPEAATRTVDASGDADRASVARQDRALAPLTPRERAKLARRAALHDYTYETHPLVIPGRGRVVGRARLPRRGVRRRSRLLGALACGVMLGVVLGGLFNVSPLAAGAEAAGPTVLQAFTNAIGAQRPPSYVWYVARPGDTVDTLARTHHCQVGGIYELNGMLAGEELQVGKAYKLPTSPTYGLYFRPVSSVSTTGTYGATVLGDHIWNSYAGIPPEGALCGPTPHGSGDNMQDYDLSSFDLKSPNWGAYWVRGFTWYHFGVDLANPMGTPIHAAQAGEVIFANWDTGGGGWSVKINNCNHLATAYGHMETLLVHDGQMVHAGDVIGLEGSTGNSTGPHVHFSVQWDNLAVDPMLFFNQSKYDITHNIPDA